MFSEKKSKKRLAVVEANNDGTTEDFTYLEISTEDSDTALKSVRRLKGGR